MTIGQRKVGDITIVDLSGRVTVPDGTDALREVLRPLARQRGAKLVLNLKDVSFIDSTALGDIVHAYTSAIRQGGSVKLLGVPHRVLELLVLTRLLSIFDLFDSETEAIRSFGSQPV
jgi:anti-sigma B factor antagonist